MTVTMNVFIVSVFAVVHNCTTVSGADPGADCVFPFTIKEVVYSACAKDWDEDDTPWCSTLTDQNGIHVGGQGKWGHCASNCAIQKGEILTCGSCN